MVGIDRAGWNGRPASLSLAAGPPVRPRPVGGSSANAGQASRREGCRRAAALVSNMRGPAQVVVAMAPGCQHDHTGTTPVRSHQRPGPPDGPAPTGYSWGTLPTRPSARGSRLGPARPTPAGALGAATVPPSAPPTPVLVGNRPGPAVSQSTCWPCPCLARHGAWSLSRSLLRSVIGIRSRLAGAGRQRPQAGHPGRAVPPRAHFLSGALRRLGRPSGRSVVAGRAAGAGR